MSKLKTIHIGGEAVEFKGDAWGHGPDAFSQCNALESVVLSSPVKCTSYNNWPIGLPTQAFLYVPKALLDQYVADGYLAKPEQFRAIEDNPDICNPILEPPVEPVLPPPTPPVS